MKSYIHLSTLAFLIVVLATGCSKSSTDPVTPSEMFPNISELSYPQDDTEHNRVLLGTWSVSFNPISLEVILEPERELNSHYEISNLLLPPYCPENYCLTFTINSYDPLTSVVDVDVEILNPYLINGYDLRLIIFTDSHGHTLVNEDDWTGLFDMPGGLPINPFKAFAKLETNRKFFAFARRTENLQILLPSGNPNVTFAIDVSYPGNCHEPYEIKDYYQENLQYTIGSSADVEVKVLDWQNDVNAVSLYCPAVTGVTEINFAQIDSETWGTTLTNNTGAPAGDYPGYIIATSTDSGSLTLYDKVNVLVSPDQGWAVSWGSTSESGIKVYSNAVDQDGNILVTGYFGATVDFDPGPDVVEHTAAGSDIFLSKFDSSGNFLWVIVWGGDNADSGRGVYFDNDENFYIVSENYGWVDFDPGPDEDIYRASYEQLSLSKFNSSGDYLWSIHMNTYMEYPKLAFDFEGSVYISGYFKGNIDFDPGSGEDKHYSAGYEDVYLCKFDQNGNYQWGLSWGGENMDKGYGIAFMEPNLLYVVGYFGGTVDFCPGLPVIEASSNGHYDAFMSKFDTSDNFYWVKTWGGAEFDSAKDITVNGLGNICVTGGFSDLVDFDPGQGVVEYESNGKHDSFVTKFGSYGNFLWTRTWGAEETDYGFQVTSSAEGAVWVLGNFEGTVDFDPGPGVDEHTSDEWEDTFMSKFNNNGDFEWVRIWESNASFTKCISTDTEENTYVNIQFYGTVDFDPGPDVDEHTSLGGRWVALIKLLPSGYWN